MSMLTDRIDRAFDAVPGKKPYLVEENRRLTYGELQDRMMRLATLFADLPPQSRVLIATTDEIQATAAFLALMRCGHAAVMADPAMPPSDIAALIKNADAAGAFLDQSILDGARDLDGSLPLLVPVKAATAPDSLVGRLASRFGLGGAKQNQPAGLEGPPGSFPISVPDDTPAYIMFTSGTTAAPKGVVIAHRNLAAHLETLVRQFGYDQDTRLLIQLPLHFTDGISEGIMVTLLAGATLYRPGRFAVPRVPDLIDWIHKHRITHFYTVPTVLALLMDLQVAANSFKTPDFRFILSSAGHLEEALWRRFEERFGVRVVNVYGLTETVSGSLYAGPDDATRRVGTLGRPVDCEIRILDEAGAEVPPGEPGELAVRGEHIFREYFRDPVGTAAALQDGWFRTGDIVTLDADGYVHLVGRLKNMIKRGGISIYPEKITSVLKEHPAVVDAAAFGISHPLWGETVMGCVILGEGKTAAPGDLMVWCRQRLAPDNVPNDIRIVAEFPRGSAGKPIIAKLREAVTTGQTLEAKGDDLNRRLYRIAADRFGTSPEELSAASTAESIPGWDSYAHMELVLEVEREFGVQMQPKDIMAIQSLGRLETILRDKLSR